MPKSFAAENFAAGSGNKIAFRAGGVVETGWYGGRCIFSEKIIKSIYAGVLDCKCRGLCTCARL
ncbi:hypothetical protein ATZ36_02220 [Candidatus Endomicrobiellum trichonymphae]|uniref:Uncharacterized protein n=1 Tax=Endomicrobium trichonymphae TaxID=1408204 RepID=A0A1E5IFR0_ENDTX|nr:hypothetical protein ATZ36_02220 [Candidatus Endomicrobium trichonymphae]